MLPQEVILNYPDFSKPFVIHSDASNLQFGTVISQDGKSLAYYTRKLNPAQKNYAVGEKELLGIVESLKAFKNVHRGIEILCILMASYSEGATTQELETNQVFPRDGKLLQGYVGEKKPHPSPLNDLASF